jgi:Raf kinase inhibitor-like YbhB/YbcL family protein
MRLVLLALSVLLGGVFLSPEVVGMSFTLHSPAFRPHGTMPVLYTCDGENLSPPLAIEGVPSGAKSLALIVDDPDAPDPKAPKRVWVHWVLANLPPTTTIIPQGWNALPTDALVGLNDSGNTRYDGPCPPIGVHRYFHKLYALDARLSDLPPHPTKAQLLAAMKGHVLAEAELIGTYGR